MLCFGKKLFKNDVFPTREVRNYLYLWGLTSLLVFNYRHLDNLRNAGL